MKKIITSLLILIVATTSFASPFDHLYATLRDNNARKPIDECILRVTYKYAHIRDTTKKKLWYDQMTLDVGKSGSKFYSSFATYADSLYTAFIKESPNKEIDPKVTNWLADSQFMQCVDYYFDYPAKGNVQTTRRIIKFNYYCDELIVNPLWAITEQTKTILGYACQKATASYKGRTWEAWFTTEIPMSLGPWKLRGLPGMILYATTDDGNFTYEAVGVEQPKSAPIYHYDYKFSKLSVSAMKKLERQLYEDPVAVMTMVGVKYATVDKNGKMKIWEAGSIETLYVPSLELE